MPELKIGVSKHTADLATRSLQDETLQMHTRELASQIVQTVLEDPKVLQQASQFIQKLSTMSNTRDAIRNLVVQTLEDRTTMQKLHESAAALTATLLENPEVRAQLIQLVQATLNDHRTNEAVMQVVTRVLQDASIRQNVIDLAAQLLLEKNVEQSVTTTITSSVHNTLGDEEIQAHAKDFVSNVVRDHTVQAQSSEALWRTVQYAVTPSWLSWLWPGTTTTLPEQKDITVHDIQETHQGADGMTKEQGGASLDSKSVTSDENTDNSENRQLSESTVGVELEPPTVNASIPAVSESCTFEESLTDQDWNHQGFL
uniref:Uncharacterized protein AlNc14C44G3612 n=1 Tax=Albugo laibachii Nc14 TaxID=890382 RepID=F0WA82_9STRA|nr:conserved hypothetical protein [Albugo laibachii Nc14]|eukprot:CCA18052.1 conserved hypothetical protein [Albugo laibachii Nc14]